MKNQILYEFLFASNTLPEELKDDALRNELIKQVDLIVHTMQYNHNVLLFEAGTIPERVYFVESGIVRGYTSNPRNNKEKTVAIWFPNSLMTDVNGFIHQIPSKISIEVMPNARLSSISYSQLEEIKEAFPSTKAFLTCLIENDIRYSNKALLDQCLTAWERLVQVRKTYPGLELLVSKKMIASFINITPQHLSKIIREHMND